MKTKTCTKCGKEQSIDQFTKKAGNRDGLKHRCKACVKKINAAYREKNREHIAVQKAEHYKKNKEKILAYQAAYSKANKEKVAACHAAWYQKNRDAVIARTGTYQKEHRKECAKYNVAYREVNKEYISIRRAKYRAENKKIIAAGLAAYYIANRDKIRARSADYYKANKERIAPGRAAYKAKRRALEKNVTVERDLPAIKAFYETAKNGKKIRCYLCRKLISKGDRHVDHIIPLGKGGNHSLANLAITHSHCNMEKNAKMPEGIGLLL